TSADAQGYGPPCPSSYEQGMHWKLSADSPDAVLSRNRLIAGSSLPCATSPALQITQSLFGRAHSPAPASPRRKQAGGDRDARDRFVSEIEKSVVDGCIRPRTGGREVRR